MIAPARHGAVDAATLEPRVSRASTAEREFQVLSAFREAFGRGDVSLDDDFFRLGGGPREARLIRARLEVNSAEPVPRGLLVRCPTSRLLAQAIGGADDRPGTATATIVPLNDQRAGDPVFFLHAVGGNPLVFRPLIDAIGLSRPAYGVRAPDLDWNLDVLDIAEMAAYYRIQIQRIQPSGPYSLVGYSFGTLLAFEIALHLHLDGHEVRHLVMLDALSPSLKGRMRTRALQVMTRLSPVLAACLRGLKRPPRGLIAVAFGTGPLTASELGRLLQFGKSYRRGQHASGSIDDLREAAVHVIQQSLPRPAWERAKAVAGSDDPAAILKGLKIWIKNMLLAGAYRPTGRCDRPITIYADEHNRGAERWQRWSAKPLQLMRIPLVAVAEKSAHASMLELVNVPRLAEPLRRLLDDGRGTIAERSLATGSATSPHIPSSRSTTEAAVARIWADVLSVQSVPPVASFFDLGGSSTLMMRVLMRIAETFDVEVSAPTFFAAPTVYGVASAVELHQRTLAVCRQVLGDAGLGLDDPVASGESGAAAVLRIAAALSIDLADHDASSLTPRAIAATALEHLRRPTLAHSECLVALHFGAATRPVFLMHAADGGPWHYQQAVRRVRPGFPVYATRAPDLDWNRTVLDIATMAAIYAAEIRVVQPRGPYSIGGVGFGAILAFEVAGRLCADGQEVADLVLGDGVSPGSRGDGSELPPHVARVCRTWGAGPLTDRELRLIAEGRGNGTDTAADFERLCIGAQQALTDRCGEPAWSRYVDTLDACEPIGLIKALKVRIKNEKLAQRYRFRRRHDGPLTVVTDHAGRASRRWRRASSRPPEVRGVDRARVAPAFTSDRGLADQVLELLVERRQPSNVPQ